MFIGHDDNIGAFLTVPKAAYLFDFDGAREVVKIELQGASQFLQFFCEDS